MSLIDYVSNKSQIREWKEQISEHVFTIEDIEKPLKIKVWKVHSLSGEVSYMGIANLKVKGSQCADYYRSITTRPTPEEAVMEALSGFFAFLDDDAQVKEVSD